MIISIQNQKGGVGKTATAVTLAAIARAVGHRALLIDLDPQGSATEQLAGDMPAVGLAHVLSGLTPIVDGILEVRPPQGKIPALHLLAADDGLLDVPKDPSRTNHDLDQHISSIQHLYDIVLIDVGPGISQLSASALFAADVVVCPVTLSAASMRGVQRLRAMTHLMNSPPPVYYLPTMLDRRMRESREILTVLHEAFGAYPKGNVLRPIRSSSALSRAFGENLTIVEYAQAHRTITGRPEAAANRAVMDYAAAYDALTTLRPTFRPLDAL